MPLEVLGMFQDKGEEVECNNPDFHDGRIRSFQHVRGNWATLVYIPGKTQELIISKQKVYFNPNTSKDHGILHRIILVPPGVKVFR